MLIEISANIKNVNPKMDTVDSRVLHSVARGSIEECNQALNYMDAFYYIKFIEFCLVQTKKPYL